MIGTREHPPSPPELAEALAELSRDGVPAATANFPIGPDVLSWVDRDRVTRACEAFFAGVDLVLQDGYGGDWRTFAEAHSVPPHELDLLDATPNHDWAMIARPDIVIGADRIAVVEPNAAPMSALFALHDMLLRAHTRMPGTERLLIESAARPTPVMPTFARMVRSHLRMPDSILYIGYWEREDLDPNDPPSPWHYRTLVAELARHGVRARFGPVEALEFREDRVLLESDRVGAVYRHFESPEAEATAERELLKKLLSYVARGEVELITGFVGEVCVSKIFLAMLSDERYLTRMPGELASQLRACVPWTRVIVDGSATYRDSLVDLLPWARKHQPELILKPVRGHAGIDVVVGREVSAADWDGLLERAAHDHADGSLWLLQELVDGVRVPYLISDGTGGWRQGDTIYIASAFMIDRKVLGQIHRYGTNAGGANINCRTGYSPVPVWWTQIPTDHR